VRSYAQASQSVARAHPDQDKRTRRDSLAKIIADLNPMLRGWFNHFKRGPSVIQVGIDGFARRGLRALLRKQEKRPGMGRCFEETTDWRAVCGRTARPVRRAGTA